MIGVAVVVTVAAAGVLCAHFGLGTASTVLLVVALGIALAAVWAYAIDDARRRR